MSSEVNAKYVGVGPHMLPNGSTILPEQTVSVDKDDPEIAHMFDDGRFIDTDEEQEPTRAQLLSEATALDIEGRHKMNVETLTEEIAKAREAKENENGGGD